MTVIEMQEQKLNLQAELKGIIEKGETEKRQLEDAENSRMQEIRTEIDNLDSQIQEEERKNAELEKQVKENKEIKENKETNTMKEIRLFDVIKGVAEGNVTEEMRSLINGNTIHYRAAVQAQSTGHGEENVAEDKKALDVAIRNASVLNKIGCTWFSNAVGHISMPKYSGSNVGWKGEITGADDGAGTFSEVNLKPKRLTAYVDISRTFLNQDSNDAEGILIRDLAEAVAEKLDMTIFGAESGTTDRPEGIFHITGHTTTGTSLASASYDDVLALEEGVELKNGTNFIFIANPKVKYAYKGIQKGNGLLPVFDKNEMDGYKTFVSNSVVSKGIVCMDPRDLAVATWNGIEVQVDTVSRAIYNEVRLVVNFYVDAKLRGDRIAAEIFS